jgi:hypothetical protein
VYDRKSTTGYISIPGRDAVMWISKKQDVLLSSTKAEHMEAVKRACEADCLRRIFGDLQIE